MAEKSKIFSRFQRSFEENALEPPFPTLLPKGMMGCGCSLLHRQVHEFLARWKAGYEYLFVCVKRNKMDSELLTCLLKFI